MDRPLGGLSSIVGSAQVHSKVRGIPYNNNRKADIIASLIGGEGLQLESYDGVSKASFDESKVNSG
jgi:hypothetical protein